MKPLRKSGGSHFSDILRRGPDISGPRLSMSERRCQKSCPNWDGGAQGDSRPRRKLCMAGTAVREQRHSLRAMKQNLLQRAGQERLPGQHGGKLYHCRRKAAGEVNL